MPTTEPRLEPPRVRAEQLHIWEAASYFEDVKKFAAALAKLGFDVTAPSVEGAFVRIYAIKNAKKPDAKLVLPSRRRRRRSSE